MIKRYDPFQDFIVLKDAFRTFEEGLSQTENTDVWTPATDVLEDENSIIVRCDLAGVDKENIKIDIEGDKLSIRGERKRDSGKYLKAERPEGVFARSFRIGIPIEQEKIKASYKNGVLDITVPKAEKLAQKKIEITS
ncbi:MAG: Hsp20/alpha crystallin family protein [Armatimonadetes bacterium]|nr:Hsp20/alpha crystallin family protein [Candidatus Hippobium faecium]